MRPDKGTVERRTFTFKRCLGRGGFGEVYLATMTSAGGVTTDVAVKVLLQDVDVRSQAVQRLRDEGKLLGALNHPAILRVHDIVLLDHRVALVTEYVDGQDVAQILNTREPVPVRALVEIVARVADALHAAWTAPNPRGGEMHLVHRDIKPANIRLGRHGDVKVLDFGIARASNEKVEREAQTATNVVVGSFGYISPERMFSSGSIVPAGDVFALGCVLYQCLVREPYFHRVEERRMYQLALDPDAYAEFLTKRLEKAKAHGELAPLLQRMLAFDPDHRPTAHEVASTCERLTEDMPGVGLKRWCRERAWPDPDKVDGALDGKVITEATLVRTGASKVAEVEAPASSGSVAKTGLLLGGGLAMGLASAGGALALVLLVGLVAWLAWPTAPAAPPAPPTAAAVAPSAPPKPVEKAAEPAKAEPAPAVTAAATAPEPKATAPKTTPKAPPPQAPEPPPEPAPAPKSTTGTVSVEGGVKIELWRNGKTLAPGAVAPGTYEVRADYGNGLLSPVESIDVKSGATVVLKCSKLRQTCAVEYR